MFHGLSMPIYLNINCLWKFLSNIVLFIAYLGFLLSRTVSIPIINSQTKFATLTPWLRPSPWLLNLLEGLFQFPALAQSQPDTAEPRSEESGKLMRAEDRDSDFRLMWLDRDCYRVCLSKLRHWNITSHQRKSLTVQTRVDNTSHKIVQSGIESSLHRFWKWFSIK